jgi:uncharacterized membrane protein
MRRLIKSHDKKTSALISSLFHLFFFMPHFLFAFGLSSLLVVYTQKKKSLSKDGALGAFILGMATFSSSLYVFTVVLLTFFLTSSKLTKFKAERKRVLEADYEALSQRNLTQVICNGLLGGITVSLFQWFVERQSLACYDHARWSTILLWAYLG